MCVCEVDFCTQGIKNKVKNFRRVFGGDLLATTTELFTLAYILLLSHFHII